MQGYSDSQMELVHKLVRLAGYAGREADDEFRDLIGDIQDELEHLSPNAR